MAVQLNCTDLFGKIDYLQQASLVRHRFNLPLQSFQNNKCFMFLGSVAVHCSPGPRRLVQSQYFQPWLLIDMVGCQVWYLYYAECGSAGPLGWVRRLWILAVRCGWTWNRVSSGQGEVREIPDFAKVREKSGDFVEGQGKNEYWEKSGNLHLVQSK